MNSPSPSIVMTLQTSYVSSRDLTGNTKQSLNLGSLTLSDGFVKRTVFLTSTETKARHFFTPEQVSQRPSTLVTCTNSFDFEDRASWIILLLPICLEKWCSFKYSCLTILHWRSDPVSNCWISFSACILLSKLSLFRRISKFLVIWFVSLGGGDSKGVSFFIPFWIGAIKACIPSLSRVCGDTQN